jgi:hypothetical protein
LADSGQFTYEAWVKADATAPSAMIAQFVSGDASPVARQSLYLEFVPAVPVPPAAASYHFTYADTSNSISSSDVQTDQWYHLAVTVGSGGAGNLYLNGQQEATFTVSSPSRPQIGDLFNLGTDQTHSVASDWMGSIDDVRVWQVERTQAEIQADMNQALTGSEAGLGPR